MRFDPHDLIYRMGHTLFFALFFQWSGWGVAGCGGVVWWSVVGTGWSVVDDQIFWLFAFVVISKKGEYPNPLRVFASIQ